MVLTHPLVQAASSETSRASSAITSPPPKMKSPHQRTTFLTPNHSHPSPQTQPPPHPPPTPTPPTTTTITTVQTTNPPSPSASTSSKTANASSPASTSPQATARTSKQQDSSSPAASPANYRVFLLPHRNLLPPSTQQRGPLPPRHGSSRCGCRMGLQRCIMMASGLLRCCRLAVSIGWMGI